MDSLSRNGLPQQRHRSNWEFRVGYSTSAVKDDTRQHTAINGNTRMGVMAMANRGRPRKTQVYLTSDEIYETWSEWQSTGEVSDRMAK